MSLGKKISELPVATTLTGLELAVVVQTSTTKQSTPEAITASVSSRLDNVVSVNNAALTSINNTVSALEIRVSAVSARASVNAAAITSINAVVSLKVNRSGDTMTGPLIVNVSSASDALRITQTGSGNALVVEDSANPDATPFVVDAIGNVGIGTSSPQNRLQVNGSFGRGAPVTKTGSFTLADTENWIICNGTGSITVTFPAASSWTGREVMIKTIAAQTVVSASSDVVPLAGGAAGTAILSATAGAWATLVSDGTNWIIMQA